MPYQDTIEDGRVTVPGDRACAPRYEAIRGVAVSLPRGFSVLDLGAASGYFGIMLAREFGARPTFVEKDDTDRLAQLIQSNGIAEYDLISKRVKANDLPSLGRYHMTLALSVLHHFANPLAAAHHVLHSADTVIIETPVAPHPALAGNSTIRVLHDYLAARGPSRIASTASAFEGEPDRPTFAFGQRVRVGTVLAGGGHTSQEMPAYQEAAEALAGPLHPGSLNLIVDRPLELREPIPMGSPWGTFELFRGTIGVTRCAFVRTPIGERGPHFIEAWASPNLRELYGLSDGDRIVLTVDPEHIR